MLFTRISDVTARLFVSTASSYRGRFLIRNQNEKNNRHSFVLENLD